MFLFFTVHVDFLVQGMGMEGRFFPNLVFIAWKMPRGQGGGVSEDMCGVGGAGSLETRLLLVGAPSFSLLGLVLQLGQSYEKILLIPSCIHAFILQKHGRGSRRLCSERVWRPCRGVLGGWVMHTCTVYAGLLLM